jgi:histidyl-tRNA synthetase
MAERIEPRVLKGFRDYLPEAEIERSALMRSLEATFRSFGFVPIDTPVLEYAEILLGKGGGETDKQVYRFSDHGGREVAMRFDLTVPFARFMAEHVDGLYLPFRRYHMAKVWRGENTQRGRYREFMQCDFDIVGADSASADADIVLCIAAAMEALGAGQFTIRISHRGIFNRFLEGLGGGARTAAVLRIVDKLEKVGEDEVRAQLAAEAGSEAAKGILDFIRKEADFDATLAKLESLCGGPSPGSERLRAVWAQASEAGTAGRLVLDPSITRGLDYYTGIVFETSLDALPQIGSVCSGGRYDELASLYTDRKLPGVGASVGLDRLLAALESMGKSRKVGGYTDLIVLNVDEAAGCRYQAIAGDLRKAGLACEVYPEKRKLAQQFAYAERKDIPLAIIAGSEELNRGVVQLRDLKRRESAELPYAAGPDGSSGLVVAARSVLARGKG